MTTTSTTATTTTTTNSVMPTQFTNHPDTMSTTTTAQLPLPSVSSSKNSNHNKNNNNKNNNSNSNNNVNIRKASNASTISSHRSTTRSSISSNSNHRIKIDVPAITGDGGVGGGGGGGGSTTGSSNICDRRLPRKKRKESNEEDMSHHNNDHSNYNDPPTVPLPPLSNDGRDDSHHDNSAIDGSTAVATTTTPAALSSSFPDLGLRKNSIPGDAFDFFSMSATTTTFGSHSVYTTNNNNNNNNNSTTIRKSSHDATNSLSNNSRHSFVLPSLDGTDFLAVTTTTTTTKPRSDSQQHSSSTTGPIGSDHREFKVKVGKRERSESTTSQQHNISRDSNQRQLVPTVLSTNTNMSDHHPLPMRSVDDNSSQDETFAGSGHRVLMEAILMSGAGSIATATAAGGGGTAMGGTTIGGGGGGSISSKTPLEPVHHSSFSVAGGGKNTHLNYRDRFDSTASSFRYNVFNGQRDRLESWGGMSDLSVGPNASDSVIASAVAAATNLHNGLLFEDPENDDADQQLPELQMSTSFGHEDQNHDAIPSKISLPPYRDRLGSIASLGDLSVTNLNNNLTIDGIDVPGSDLQAFVAAAMASVGDQLIEFAGAMEELTGESMTSEDLHREFTILNDGADCSVASPMIGAVSDIAGVRRQRAWSTSSRLPVDIEAVNAAVEAAYSVGMVPTIEKPTEVKSNPNDTVKKTRMLKRTLPTKKTRNEINASSSQSITSENRQSDTVAKVKSSKKRSRKSEGSTTESIKPGTPKKMAPLKKRPLEKIFNSRKSITPSSESTIANMKTPLVSNRTLIVEPIVSELHVTPSMVLSISPDVNNKNCAGDGGASGQANQKWEKMFECMMEFAEERKLEDTKDMTDKEKEVWIWDGNVPTNYKSKDGMALGRWVNNQRSAKAKGTLKDDREQRLIGAGLKWSVLASNSWNEMLEELSIYIKDQHRQSKVWDGNVPTNYQIKSRPDGEFNGEDKNLGRWVNRQRSLYQSGKLRKERKLSLEGVGLKWSMLATTSWDGMYDTLKEYVEQQIKKLGSEKWDGNVPANHRTNDNPPRALGRWVNRQRSAFAKKKLKDEFVDKLNVLGLKWSVHHRPGEMDENDDGEFGDGDEFEDPIDTITPDKCVSAAESKGRDDSVKEMLTEDGATTQEV